MIRSSKAKKGKKTSKRRKSRLALRRECDKLFAQRIKDRDGWACRACGSIQGIQCAHICSRRYHATRWTLGNAVALCARCHMRWTNDPLGWDAWVEERIGEAGYLELKRLARQGVSHIDYEAILAQLGG
jgi:hypothetical protein